MIEGEDPCRIPEIYGDPLATLVQSMLEKDPNKRPDAYEILKTAVVQEALREHSKAKEKMKPLG